MQQEKIHVHAQSLPLEKRYSFYLEILNSRIPENPDVADDLVLLGKPARDYILKRAVADGRKDLLDALPALAAFDGSCTSKELEQLNRKAKSVAHNRDDLNLIRRHILIACEASPELR